jgi:hypothetical protein
MLGNPDNPKAPEYCAPTNVGANANARIPTNRINPRLIAISS